MTYTACTLTIPFGVFTVIAEGDLVVAGGFSADVTSLRPRLPDPTAAISVRDGMGDISTALAAYFDGDVTAIDPLPVRAEGSPVMRRLWAELRLIPAGEVRSYAELGGGRRHARVAGAACARNPIPLVIPCHRVVRSDGGLGGFGWGLPIKTWLLDHERAATGREGHERRPASAGG